MDLGTRLELIKSEPTEEIITEERLRHLLETKARPRHYIGFEISGMLHLGALVSAKKVNDLAKAGIETQIYLADWHTMANNKLGGDWERIRKVADFYKRLFRLVCPDTKIVLGSELYKDNDAYWRLVLQMSRKVTLARATRTLVIMGRSEKDTLHVSQYLYPIMQAADIEALGADIPHAGIDQRKVHVLAMELFKDLRMREIVPLHHHLLPSFSEPPKIPENAEKEEIVAAMKMSKSKPGSFVPILATRDEIHSILKSAWCPAGTVVNPVLELYRFLLFPWLGKLSIERDKAYGGDVEYESYKSLETDFLSKKLHPVDLKNGAADALSRIMEPISKKFGGERAELERLIG